MKTERAAQNAAEVTSDARLQASVFTILWAIAHIADMLRTRDPDSPLVWLVLLAALLLIERPTARWRLAVLAGAELLLAADGLPRIDNHLVIMSFVNLGLLVSLAVSLRSRASRADASPPAGALPYARLVLLVAYGAAAMAKLNDGFFDTDHSCAVTLFDNATSVFGSAGSQLTDAVAPMLPFVVAGAELAIPILLLVPATRLLAVAFTIVFHLVMSLSPHAIGLGFTFVVVALSFLFLPDLAARHIRKRMGAVGTVLGLRGWRRAATFGAVFVALAILVTREIGFTTVDYPNWLVLAPAALAIGVLLLDTAWRAWRERWPRALAFRPRHLAYFALLALVVLNAAAPYLGGKTISSFTMYSNLQTERAASNHFFLPRVSLATGQDDLVEIVGSSNAELRKVRDQDGLLTWHELRRKLASDPTARVTYMRGGELFSYAQAHENPELVDRDPVTTRLLGYRVVDRDGAVVRCRW